MLFAGESKFTIDTLSMAIESSKEQIRINEQKLTDLEFEILDQEGAMKRLDYYYEQFQSWANEFESASMEQQKMIICQLISRIEFQRGYEMNIRFNMNYEQFFHGMSDDRLLQKEHIYIYESSSGLPCKIRSLYVHLVEHNRRVVVRAQQGS